MVGFELRISDARGNRSTNCTKNTAQMILPEFEQPKTSRFIIELFYGVTVEKQNLTRPNNATAYPFFNMGQPRPLLYSISFISFSSSYDVIKVFR